MAIFSPKARRTIEAAVAQLPDDFQRQTWDAWSRANPDMRRAGDPFAGFQEIPSGVAVVALGALERMATNLARSLSDPTTEEDLNCEIEGDITFIKTIEAMLIEGLHSARVAA